MTIKSIQKVIRVGSSLAVTIPARDAKSLGITAGKNVEVSVTPIKNSDPAEKQKDLTAEYEAFKAQYGDTLENLSDR